MDDKEFRTRLSEVAHWIIPDTPRETSVNAKKTRGRKSHEDDWCEMHEELFLEHFDGKNPTHAPMLVNVHIQAVHCEHCGQHCAKGRETEARLHLGNKKMHWRHRCVTCNRSKNPYTGEFDLRPGKTGVVWNQYLRDSKGAYKTARNFARQLSATSQHMQTHNTAAQTVIEDTDGIIKIFTDSNLP